MGAAAHAHALAFMSLSVPRLLCGVLLFCTVVCAQPIPIASWQDLRVGIGLAPTTTNTEFVISGQSFNASYDGEIHVEGKNVTVRCDGAILDAASNGRFFTVSQSGGLALDSAILRNGRARSGGAIFVDSGCTLSVINATLSNNTADDPNSGGGAICSKGALSLLGSTFAANTATGWGGGGAILVSFVKPFATARVEACAFERNAAGQGGGGAIVLGSGAHAVLTDSAFSANHALGLGGGALHLVSGSSVRVAACRFERNTAASVAGAVYLSPEASCSIRDALFAGNAAPRGGALYLDR
jgi:predicted outer membrane repeat protein